ncbi:Sip1-related alpha-galactosidase [Sediminibacillus massiliensis]|uniref:Sip1-related alpha-galactosidase n=1 Tax=Sediminibacillus massiliensis TaxID=1926277 RepID=UPI0009886EE5|nr:Sip1-related alpha-galactosidase [Sediminibacillus massiliensis]
MQSNLNNDFVQLFLGGEKIFSGVYLELHLAQAGKIDLEFVELKKDSKENQFGEYERLEYLYKHGDMVDFSFILHCFDNSIHAFTDITVHSERLFGRNDYLLSEKSVLIKIKNEESVNGLVSYYRHKDWWTRPHFSHDFSTIPSSTQALIWKGDGSYYYLVPVTGPVFKSEAAGTDNGFQLSVSSYDDSRNECKTPVFVMGKDQNPFHLSNQVTSEVLKLSGKTNRTIAGKQYPEKLDYLGWCSWDAFYQKVNEDGILDKMKELKEKKVPVKWLMIDDGWSQTNNERLTGLEPDTVKFPNAFKNLTNELKDEYGVLSVGVWHTLAGYWGGIDPESPLAGDLAPNLYKTKSNKLIPYPDKGKGFGFWDAWHSYLKEQGIDFVKVDGQSAINNFMMGDMSVGESSIETHKALEASVGIHFDQCMINCMGMAPENIWNRPASSLSRSSDDFVPEDENGFSEHVMQNVYNSFYHGELYWGDWDMFWTTHQDAKRHALLRAISGGPIYTSDPVGQTDEKILWPLLYNDGRILRCDQPGRPTADTLLVDPTNGEFPLKVWNTSNGIGLLAAFNISDGRANGTISPADIEGIYAENFYVYDYFNQTIASLEPRESIEISLNEREDALYFIVPQNNPIQPIGLLNKFVSPASFAVQYRTKDKIAVSLREGGLFSFISEEVPGKVTVNGEEVPVDRLDDNGSVYSIDCSDVQDTASLIEISC